MDLHYTLMRILCDRLLPFAGPYFENRVVILINVTRIQEIFPPGEFLIKVTLAEDARPRCSIMTYVKAHNLNCNRQYIHMGNASVELIVSVSTIREAQSLTLLTTVSRRDNRLGRNWTLLRCLKKVDKGGWDQLRKLLSQTSRFIGYGCITDHWQRW